MEFSNSDRKYSRFSPEIRESGPSSGKDRRTRSCSCKSCEAWVMEIPGSEVGMYKDEPSYKGGINWLPNLNISGKVTTRNSRLSRRVVFRYLRHNFRTGR